MKKLGILALGGGSLAALNLTNLSEFADIIINIIVSVGTLIGLFKKSKKS